MKSKIPNVLEIGEMLNMLNPNPHNFSPAKKKRPVLLRAGLILIEDPNWPYASHAKIDVEIL